MRVDLARVRTLARRILGPSSPPRSAAGQQSRPTTPPTRPSSGAGAYPGDHHGRPDFEYRPVPDGLPDPGEVVWTWVPYEEDHTQGKDRPVLLVGREDTWLLGLPMTSKDHDRDAEQERAAGRHWFDLGSGPWDSRGRSSEVRLDRVLRVDAEWVRREGAVLDRERFEAVARAFDGLPRP